jgi:hypothetical protein
MGSGNWVQDAFKTTSRARASAPPTATFRATATAPTMAANKIVVRESRDSVDHPNSNPIMVFFDVTGSMGEIPHYFAHTALGALMEELLAKLPVTDPQLCVGAIGDYHCDKSPFQVGQFESDNTIDKWLTSIHLEGGGGGQNKESYNLAYWFAGRKTVHDAMQKRGRKGYLFTIGDEHPYSNMSANEIKEVFGEAEASDCSFADAIAAAKRLYHCFHIVVKSDSYPIGDNLTAWRKYLGQNVLQLPDYRALPELILTTIALNEGMSEKDTMAGFSAASTALVKGSGVLALSKAPENTAVVTY